MKRLFIIFGLIYSFLVVNVYATNDVDYKLTITEDHKFQEVITYSITNYKQIENGSNHFYDVINNDFFTNFTGKVKYEKSVKKESNRYVVVLKHDFTEYTYSNSYFLNGCFEEGKFSYDMYTYKFKNTGFFNCKYGDSLKITVITNENVKNTNATISGNSYSWNVEGSNLPMNIEIDKEYKTSDNSSTIYDDIQETDNNTNNNTNNNSNNNNTNNNQSNNNQSQSNNEKVKINKWVVGGIAGASIIALAVAAIILKKKTSDLNKI